MAGYFHFPLCLLGYGDDEKRRLHFIISYNVVTFARRSGKKLTLESLEAAQEALGVACEDPFAHENRWERANTFVQRREKAYGKDAFVRIACQLLWDCLSGALPYREFSLLCAINSALGASKKPKRITEPTLCLRAAGYKSWKDYQADVPAEQREVKLLTKDQTRRALERLQMRKFFARARSGARTVKYLAGVSDEQLREMLVQTQTYSARFRRGRAEGDAAMRAQIKAARSKPINVGTPINVGAPINVGVADKPQKTADTARHDPDMDADMDADMVPTWMPTYNVSFSNRSISNESLCNGSNSNVSPSNEAQTQTSSGLSSSGEKKEEKEEHGFLIEGRYFTVAEATKFVTDNPDAAEAITTKARRAKKRGDRWTLQ